MPKPIVLAEYEKWSGQEKVTAQERKKAGESLGKEDEIVFNELKRLYEIEHNFSQNHELEIKANQHIGSVFLPNMKTEFQVIPKMFKDKKEKLVDTSILLAFANNISIKEIIKEQKNLYSEDMKSLLINPLHWTLSYQYDKLARQGLLKSYVVHAENTSSMRGKLLMKQQMLNDVLRRPKFFCEYDELEYDTVENRVLLQAMTIVERTSQIPFFKMKAMNNAQRLSGVVTKEDVRKPQRQRMMRSYNRQNARYREIHQTCEIIIERQGIGNIYSGNYSHIVPMFYNMNLEFEGFVQNLFKKYYYDPDQVKIQSSDLAWSSRYSSSGNRRMRPDIIIQEGDEVKEIIDVKYKMPGVSTGDLYQIGFYMHEYGKKNKNEIKHAFAILPKDGDKEEKVSYEATKTEKMVHIKRIDVNDCVQKIKADDEDGLQKIVISLIQE